MKKVIFLLLVILLVCPLFTCLPVDKVSAVNISDVFINEIAWMGTTGSANDEWIELKNNTANIIDLTGWSIQSGDGKLKINLKGTVLANGFYLIERTDDTTVPNLAADLIYKGTLPNTGIDLGLYDATNRLIDAANCAGGWFAGDNTSKQTMERNINGWQTSQNPEGTPMAENSSGITIISKTGPSKPTNNVTDSIKALPTTKNSVNNSGINPAVADLSQSTNISQDNNATNPWFLFFIVLATTIILAVIVLIIKIRFMGVTNP